MTVVPPSTHRRAAVAAELALLGGALAAAILAPHEDLGSPLMRVLALCCLASMLAASKWDGSLRISAAFVCLMPAVAFVGPVGALTVAVAAELGAWLFERYRLVVLLIVAFNYMSRLVVIARQRAGQYAALSWGGCRRSCARWIAATAAPPATAPPSLPSRSRAG